MKEIEPIEVEDDLERNEVTEASTSASPVVELDVDNAVNAVIDPSIENVRPEDEVKPSVDDVSLVDNEVETVIEDQLNAQNAITLDEEVSEHEEPKNVNSGMELNNQESDQTTGHIDDVTKPSEISVAKIDFEELDTNYEESKLCDPAIPCSPQENLEREIVGDKLEPPEELNIASRNHIQTIHG